LTFSFSFSSCPLKPQPRLLFPHILPNNFFLILLLRNRDDHEDDDGDGDGNDDGQDRNNASIEAEYKRMERVLWMEGKTVREDNIYS